MIKRDPRWEIMYGDISIETFAQKMPKLNLRPEVPGDVCKGFEILSKLLVFSYYEYQFIDVAVPRAFHLCEMALKSRYSDLNDGKIWDQKKPFAQLLDWFSRRDYFEREGSEESEAIRTLRNYLSHPDRLNILGLPGLQLMSKVTATINGLHDDLELRRERWKMKREALEVLRAFVDKGIKFVGLGKERLCFDVGPVVVSNLGKSAMCYFSLVPVFDDLQDDSSPMLFSYPVEKLKIINGKIDLSFGAKIAVLTSQLSESEQRRIEEFKNTLSNRNEFLGKVALSNFLAAESISKELNESSRNSKS